MDFSAGAFEAKQAVGDDWDWVEERGLFPTRGVPNVTPQTVVSAGRRRADQVLREIRKASGRPTDIIENGASAGF